MESIGSPLSITSSQGELPTQQVEPSTSSAEPNAILAKIGQKARSVTHWCMSTIAQASLGAVAGIAFQAVVSGGKSVYAAGDALLHPENHPYNLEMLHQEFDAFHSDFIRSTLGEISSHFSWTDIENSSCPKQEFLRQVEQVKIIKNMYYETNRPLLPIVSPIVVGSCCALLQQVVLKRLAGRILNKVSPQHASIIDSKIYTACRVALTALCASALFYPSGGRDDMAMSVALITGMGILAETHGLTASLSCFMTACVVEALAHGFYSPC